MTLDKKVFMTGIERLIVFYPTWGVKYDSKNDMLIWYEMFKDISNDRFNGMIDNFINKSTYVPTVASLKECLPPPERVKLEIVYEESWNGRYADDK